MDEAKRFLQVSLAAVTFCVYVLSLHYTVQACVYFGKAFIKTHP